MKKAFVISAILIVIIIVISIIIAVINIKPATFKSVVSYDTNTAVLKEAPVYARTSNTYSTNYNGMDLIENLLKYDKIIMVSSMIIIIIFALLFYGAKRSKS